MSIKLVQAHIKSVAKQLTASASTPGVLITCIHHDPQDPTKYGEHGKRITQWIWWRGDPADGNIRVWAGFAGSKDDDRDILSSHALCGVELDLIVDDSGKYWEIERAGLRGTLEPPTPTTVNADDIPF